MSSHEFDSQQQVTTWQRLLRGLTRVSAPIRALIGIAAIALGALLVLAPITVHGVSIIVGLGFVIAGFAHIFGADHDDAGRPTAGRLQLFGGALIIAMGALMALWPVAGAPFLAYLTGITLLVHGALGIIAGLRGSNDQRFTAVIAGLATILVGVLTFSWPVLTLTIFRFALGFWLGFLGLQLLIGLILKRRTRAAAATRPNAFQRWAKTIGASLALVVAAALVWGSGVILGGVALPEPGEFYSAPAQLPSEPGTLIRSEPLEVGVPDGAEAWKILYTTTHADGSPAISSGLVIAPRDRDGTELPLLTVAHGTTGVAPKCAPSMSATPFADGAGSALTKMVADHGWAAVISDYIGLGTQGPHPYLIGETEARNSLDASRAAAQLTEIKLSRDTIVWGHSQGGQASLWIGQIAGDYAPELTIKGVAAFAPAADLYGLAEADKDNAGGKTVSAYIAATWNELFPDLKLSEQLTPGSSAGVERISDLCFNGKDVLAAILTGTQVPNQVFPDALLDGTFGDQLKAQTPVGPWPAPVLVAQGLSDPLVLPQLQEDWVSARCAAGTPIDFRTYAGRDHVSLVAEDSPLTPQLIEWTLDRWAGDAVSASCTSEEY